MDIIEKGTQTKEEVVQVILNRYFENDIVMGEFLETIELRGFSIVEIVEIYAKLINLADDDILTVEKEGELFVIT